MDYSKANENDYVDPDSVTLIEKHMIPHTVPDMDAELKMWECIVCKQPVSEHDRAISCDICEEYQHIACHNIMSINEYNKLADMRETFQWFCESCKGN